MRYTLAELSTLPVVGAFTTLDTVTISIYDLATGLEEPVDSASCTEILTTGKFSWNFSNLTDQPTEFKRFLWVMDNGSTKVRDVVDVAGWVEKVGVVNNIIEFPAISMDKEAIIVGNTWTPKFDVKSTDKLMKVKIDITDGGGNVLSKATSNVAGGGDDQLKLLCSGDTFQTFRLYVSATESAQFIGGRTIHMNITVTLTDLTVLTIAHVVPTSQTVAITWG